MLISANGPYPLPKVPDDVGLAQAGEIRPPTSNPRQMTRTAATPAPRNGRNGKVRTVKVSPEQLQEIDAAAPTLALPAHLAAALQTATAAQQQRQQTRKAPTPRVSLTPAEQATLEAIGWNAPTVDANHTANPQPRTRQNSCKGAAAYEAAAAILTAGQTLSLPELAALWLAAGNGPKPYQAIAQQISNRAGRPIQQSGATIALV